MENSSYLPHWKLTSSIFYTLMFVLFWLTALTKWDVPLWILIALITVSVGCIAYWLYCAIRQKSTKKIVRITIGALLYVVFVWGSFYIYHLNRQM